ncbi:MerR family transcriptional regulator [Paenibacillus cremeus]|uniref:MerR family transcriptional regulator n=1 Tax=Paenibacillus cremeus TaxID=2163881 RepID=A0A559KA52_9BACL|nr:MerR family transcriptional regulator [Paenibacillus cremeus]TVY09018.1 MerR family transcriptional regulator [Paenibacillus cremeus]
MAYTVKEISKASGVSVRTLHYYDEIGLLKPAYYGDNGYRFYEEEQLLQLQQILFFRELEFSLDEIRNLLQQSGFDRIEALHSHKKLLKDKAARLAALLLTIDKTMAHLRGETDMSKEELYYGFDFEKQKAYEQELKDRYGEGAEKSIQESKQNMKGWGKKEFEDVRAQVDEINKAMTVVLRSGAAPDSAETQAIIQKHFTWLNHFYVPTKEVYAGLGQLYCDHPDFRKLYDAYDSGLAEYMRDAMQVYADRNL